MTVLPLAVKVGDRQYEGDPEGLKVRLVNVCPDVSYCEAG